MALNLTTGDVRDLTEADLAELSAIERRILARACESEPLRITSARDRSGVEMESVGSGSPQRARIAASDVVLAILRGWTRV